MSREPGTLADAGRYTCHSDRNGIAPRRSSYEVQDGNARRIIETHWLEEINGRPCGHNTPDKDPGCEGCACITGL